MQNQQLISVYAFLLEQTRGRSGRRAANGVGIPQCTLSRWTQKFARDKTVKKLQLILKLQGDIIRAVHQDLVKASLISKALRALAKFQLQVMREIHGW